MESVAAFNNELSGLYDMRPPISKAKMAAITKSAMRAIKFYKHVVQSVEKFILKCKSEYKVPGLYVIDSIVRQSRHQFGPDKDVFAPRFARNIKETFVNLFNCAPEDKSRIIRVLNLWQKNNVFAPDVIQPIFDLADPSNAAMYAMQTGSNSGPSTSANESNLSNGLNTSGGNASMDISMASSTGMVNDDKVSGNLPDISTNNLQQLLNDPNVLRQLQTLQNFQKFKQDDKQHMFNEMRLQEEAFEKHLHNVLKTNNNAGVADGSDFHKEVEFVSEEKKIEVINLDGNDSRSPTPDRDRYKSRRRSSRSRSRDVSRRDRDRERDRRRHSRSRSRTRSPRSSRRRSSRDRDRSERSTRDKEKERERRKKGLPEIKREHLSVCTTTLWVGHLSKLVYQEELSDTFGEFGDIVSIDQIVPRGCAFIVMNRRQDAHKAMQNLKNHKLQGRAITISWAAGKGVKSKEWKDYWDLELGCTYIPWNKLTKDTDFDSLEEGGMFDDDSMPGWMKDKINQMKSLKEKVSIEHAIMPTPASNNLIFGIDTTQPPPGPPPPIMPLPTQYTMAPPRLPIGPPVGMPISGIPVHANLHVPNVPPPMVMPPTMLPPGYPPMPGQVEARPPLNLSSINLPPGAPPQYPPPPAAAAPIPPPSSDDQMDIEMDDEEVVLTAGHGSNSSLTYNQPPPIIGMNDNVSGVQELGSNGANDIFDRDGARPPAGGSSRWGERIGEHDIADGHNMWRENGQVIGPPGANNFVDGRRGGPPINFSPMDGINSQQRQDFMNDFEARGGPPRGAPPGHLNGGDFFQNMQQSRFNQPTSLMQMRIPPPNAFNPRMVGPGGPLGQVGPGGPGGPGGPPPMFMRGPGGPGPGNRQQGFFNPRNPFDRDGGGGPGGRGGGRGGGRMGGRGGGRGNWSDEETGEDGNFRRGRGPANNRFRDRDDDNWHDRNRGGGRRGGNSGDRFQRGDRYDRNSRGGREENRDSRFEGRPEDGEQHIRRDSSNEDNKYSEINKSEDSKPDVTNPISDTEEDWDRELEDYDAKPKPESSAAVVDEVETEQYDRKDIQESTTNSSSNNDDNSNIINEKELPTVAVGNTTPLYDELPPPVTNTAAPVRRLSIEEAPKAIVDVEPIVESVAEPQEAAVVEDAVAEEKAEE